MIEIGVSLGDDKFPAVFLGDVRESPEPVPIDSVIMHDDIIEGVSLKELVEIFLHVLLGFALALVNFGSLAD